MADLATKIASLNDAIANSELTVKSDGILTTFRSIDELIKARNDLQSQFDSSTPTRPRQTLVVHGGRGFR